LLGKDGTCTALEMETQYIVEMFADWMGASAAYGGDIKEWILENLDRFLFAEKTANLVGQLIYKYFGIHTYIKSEPKEGITGYKVMLPFRN